MLCPMSGEFAGLVEDNQLGRVTSSFMEIVAGSFNRDPARLTRSSVKERTEILVLGFRYLRGDMKWGVERILGELPEYLHCKLNKKPWEPPKRQCWIPGDGA